MGDDADLKALIVELRIMSQRIEELERKVEKLTAVKNIGIGVLIALSAIAGGVGAVINKVFAQ